jgi:glycosyltransferase involved in cell wall biosynthesis
MRIVLYNFLQPEEPGAGGVGVYMKNIAEALAKNHEVILLSSGDLYSPKKKEPWVDFRNDAFQRAIIVNSPVVAPAAYAFADVGIQSNNTELDFVPELLQKKYGQIDVFHFHNIEGLTRPFFYELREAFPDARIVYSAHNYHPLCARVSLWYQDRMVCTDYREGQACTVCHAPIFDDRYIRNRRRLIWAQKAHPRVMALMAPAVTFGKFVRRQIVKFRARGQVSVNPAGNALTPAPAVAYAAFRQGNIAMFRDVFDRVLAVSDRTRQVLADRGVPGDLMSISYIGTAYKETYLQSTKISDVGERLHLGYIGYMGREKGFPFLLECMERIPADLAANIDVTIAAKNTSPELHARMQRLGRRFRKLRYFNGYTHDNLGEVLDGVNVGLIPVVWEDNLPQTAIELVARGIPILTSDRGGAQEIARNAQFIFTAGEHAAFIDRVCRIARRELPLETFWKTDMQIFSMDEHVQDLMRYYRAQRDQTGQLTFPLSNDAPCA